MTHDPYDDALRFWVHFAFGALIGVVVGGSLCLQLAVASTTAAVLVVGGAAALFALAGGWWGDRFWNWILPRLRWFS